MLLKYLKASFLAEEIGLADCQMASEYPDLSVCQGSGKELADTRFHVRRPKCRRGGSNPPFEIAPASWWIVQAHLQGESFA
jgi:hypothetical protein